MTAGEIYRRNQADRNVCPTLKAATTQGKMNDSDIRLDGDPRTLARAIYQAAREAYRDKHGRLTRRGDMKAGLEAEIPALAKQMAEALDRHARDVYLINALEVMALSVARRELRGASNRRDV